MIRPSIAAESSKLIDIGIAAGMFKADETEELAKVHADYFDGKLPEGHAWLTDIYDGEVRCVAYYAPTPFADGVWDLLMIAVHPDYQRQGHGNRMLQYIEKILFDKGQRMLIVDTSGTQTYEQARKFYKKNHFEQEARIRDFYQEGEDKVTFRKILGKASNTQ
jgi:ribosomal protein S18 acetylase RimI-like enzyme